MYTVMGITGKVGGATARALLKAGKKVRAVVRDQAKAASWEAQGVELVSAPWDDAAALAAAFRGAEGVFAMVPPYFAPAAGYPEVRVVAAALRQALDAARPAKVVALSSVGAHRPRGLASSPNATFWSRKLNRFPCPRHSSGPRGSWRTRSGTSPRLGTAARSLRFLLRWIGPTRWLRPATLG